MHGGLVLRHSHREAADRSRPWPLGVGLAIGAGISLAMWAGIIKLVSGLLG